jgi:hypothetical protein
VFKLIRDADVSTANTLVPPDGKQWLCRLGQGKSMFVRECYDWFYKQAIATMAEKMSKTSESVLYSSTLEILELERARG